MSIDAVRGCSSHTLIVVGGLAFTALTIIGFVAAAGHIGNPVMGYLCAGLGGGGGAIILGGLLCRPDFKDNRRIQKKALQSLFPLAVWTTLGVLGVMGIISGVQLGWVLTSLFIAIAALTIIKASSCCIASCCRG